MSELPQGWISCQLFQISDVVTGKTPSKKNNEYFNGPIPFIKPGDVRNQGVINSTEETLTEIGANMVACIPPGSITVTCIGNLGRTAITKVLSATNQQINSVVPYEDISTKFLYYYLQTIKNWMESEASSTTVTIINKGRFLKAPILLPPANEQIRIADKLDSVLAKVDAAQARLEKIPILLKRFRQSILAAATSGELTREWRLQNSALVNAEPLAKSVHLEHEIAGGHKSGNAAAPTEGVHNLSIDMFPTGWQILTLRDAVQPNRPITYGILKPGPELEDGVPYIRVADFPGEILNLSTIRKTSNKIDEEFKRSRLRSGDLLLSIRGTVGRIIEIPAELTNANITQDTARLTIQSSINHLYVLWFLRSSLAQLRMKQATKGVAVRGINIGDVRALQLPLPSRAEQDEIVRRVESLFTLADTVEKQYLETKKRLDRLTQSLLAKAFRGELVPQDPNDEPAAELLKRIQAERNAQPPVKNKRAKSA